MTDRERTPNDRAWRPRHAHSPEALAHSAWSLGPVTVLSSLQIADLPDGSGTGPQWHVSISAKGNRPKPKQLRRALRAFDMESAEEDNHHPGVARHFWMPVDPAHRVDCECKTTETVVTDPDGYQWTNPTDGPCRGCSFERTSGKPCPIHSSDASAGA